MGNKEKQIGLYLKIDVKQNMPRPKVVMEFAIENVSEAPLLINKRFSVVPVYGDIRPKILHEGNEIAFKYRVKLRRVNSDDFIELKPKELLRQFYNLESGFSFKCSGTHKITVTYINEESPLNLVGPPVFIGKVCSEEHKFNV